MEETETPHITIKLVDGKLLWESNLPEATMLYYLDVVKHLTLVRTLDHGKD